MSNVESKRLFSLKYKAHLDPISSLEEIYNMLHNNNAIIHDLSMVVFAYGGTFEDSFGRRTNRDLIEADFAIIEDIARRMKSRPTEEVYDIWSDICPKPIHDVKIALLQAMMSEMLELDWSRMLALFTKDQFCEKRQQPCDSRVVTIAKMLIEAGADIFIPYSLHGLDDEYGSLYISCIVGNEPLIRLYVESLPKTTSNNRYILDTCLCHVCNLQTRFDVEVNFVNICRFLVSKGARPYMHVDYFDSNAIDLALEKQERGGFYDENVVEYLESLPRNTRLSDLPIRNVLSKYLNTKGTRALAASSKAVAQASQVRRNEKAIADKVFANSSMTFILGDRERPIPYPYSSAVQFRINNKELADDLGFVGFQFIFAPLRMDQKKYTMLRLIDLQVISQPQMDLYMRDQNKIKFFYTLLHRNIRADRKPYPFINYSRVGAIGVSGILLQNYDDSRFPNIDEVCDRFNKGDPLYKEIFMKGCHIALEKIKKETKVVVDVDVRALDGDAIGDIMDKFRQISSTPKSTNNSQDDYPQDFGIDHQVQNAKRKARTQVLGEYNSKLRAPFTTSQAISEFLSDDKPRGQNITRRIRERASNLQQVAQDRMANVELKYATRRRQNTNTATRRQNTNSTTRRQNTNV
jgi:hypothetical protein